MGIGGIETGVRDIAKYLNKKKIDNYILCESSNKNFDIKGLKIIKLNTKNTVIINKIDDVNFTIVFLKFLIKKYIVKAGAMHKYGNIQSTCLKPS